MVALAVAFVAVLFLLKTTSTFKNSEAEQANSRMDSLSYRDIAIESLVNKDTDGDGIVDWEESLWGTDPAKKETTSGIMDSEAIAKLKAKQEERAEEVSGKSPASEELTQTDQFSRELFGTIAALSQNGEVDEQTIDALSASLVEKIKNPASKKVFLVSDLKITDGDGAEILRSYGNALNMLYSEYKIKYTVLDVLRKFVVDENNVDVKVLLELNPIIEQTKKTITGMVKMPVPRAVADLHLEIINTLQGLVENMNDIKLYDSDTIVALSGIIKYGENAAKLENDLRNIVSAIEQKLNN